MGWNHRRRESRGKAEAWTTIGASTRARAPIMIYGGPRSKLNARRRRIPSADRIHAGA
jgi:hypothetical protein